MKIEQSQWTEATGWTDSPHGGLGGTAALVVVFGSTKLLADAPVMAHIRASYPQATLVGCSTAGEIMGQNVTDDTVTVTAIRLESTPIEVRSVKVGDHASSKDAGQALAAALPQKGLKHVLVFSDGQSVNGSELVTGLTAALPPRVHVTGGLAGDGARFKETSVLVGDRAEQGAITAVGFYGEYIQIGFGSLGGWDAFGPERLVTKSSKNVLAELEGEPALALYKKYLGPHASQLPSSGLRFPLRIRTTSGRTFVRTLLAVDELAQSLTFAGDIPEGSYARLMKANFDRLVEGAHGAAEKTHQLAGSGSPDLAILISCVGRKLVLGQRTAEEVEAVRAVLGAATSITGFYSYGEICPSAPDAGCELHNQTMTITTFTER